MRRFYIVLYGDFFKGIKYLLEMIVGYFVVVIYIYSLYLGESVVDFFGELKKKVE